MHSGGGEAGAWGENTRSTYATSNLHDTCGHVVRRSIVGQRYFNFGTRRIGRWSARSHPPRRSSTPRQRPRHSIFRPSLHTLPRFRGVSASAPPPCRQISPFGAFACAAHGCLDSANHILMSSTSCPPEICVDCPPPSFCFLRPAPRPFGPYNILFNLYLSCSHLSGPTL